VDKLRRRGAATGVNTFAQAMAALSPAGRNFVNFLIGLEKQYDTLKAATQTALLPGLQAAITSAEPLFGSLEIFILGAAQAIGSLAQQFGTFLGSSKGVSEVDAVFAQGAQFMQQLGQAAFTLFGAFLSIGSQAGGVVRALGSGILDLVDAFAKWAEGGGFQKFLTWLKDNGPGIVSDISNIAKGFGGLIVALVPIGTAVLGFLGWVAALIKAHPLIGQIAIVIGVLTAAFFVLAPIIAGIGVAIDAVGLAFETIGFVVASIAVALSIPIGVVVLIIAALIALGVGIYELVTHWTAVWSAIRDITNTVWHTIDNDVFHPIEDFFTVTIPHALSVFSGAMTTAWQSVHNILNTVWHTIDNDVFHPIADFFTQTVPQALDTAVGFFAALPGRLTDACRDIVGAAFGAFIAVGAWLDANVWSPVSNWFTSLAGRLATAIGDFFIKAWAILLQVGAWLDAHVWGPGSAWFVALPGRLATAIGDFLATAWSGLLAVGSWLEVHVWSPVSSWFTGIPGRVSTAMGDFLGTAFSALAGIGSWLANTVWPEISGFFTGLPAAIATAATGMWDGIGSAFKAVINTVIGWWNSSIGSLSITVPGWVPLIGGDKFAFPQIPPLADGGIVSAQTGGVVALVAEAGQDEVIAPLDDLAAQLQPMFAQMVAVPSSPNQLSVPTAQTAPARVGNGLNVEGDLVVEDSSSWPTIQAQVDFAFRAGRL
jgi:hypothetical protein